MGLDPRRRALTPWSYVVTFQIILQLQHTSCQEGAGSAEQVHIPAAEAGLFVEGGAADHPVSQPERCVLGEGACSGVAAYIQLQTSVEKQCHLKGS